MVMGALRKANPGMGSMREVPWGRAVQKAVRGVSSVMHNGLGDIQLEEGNGVGEKGTSLLVMIRI